MRRKPPDRIFYADGMMTTRREEKPRKAWLFLLCERNLSNGRVDQYKDVVEIGPAKSWPELWRLIRTFIKVAKARKLSPKREREVFG